MRLRKLLLLTLAVFTIITPSVRCQDDDDEDDFNDDLAIPADVPKKVVIKEFKTDLANSPTPKVQINSISPDKGPMTGETRVTVRGGPFGIWETKYPTPFVRI